MIKNKTTKKHPVKQWEISIIELEADRSKLFKVTRRLSEYAVAETKVFKNKKKAKDLFDEWLKE